MQSLFITAALGQMASQASQADWGNTQAARVAQTALLASLDAEIERADAPNLRPLARYACQRHPSDCSGKHWSAAGEKHHPQRTDAVAGIGAKALP